MDYTIYSVEDDKEISYIICTTLKKQGYTVEAFYDGKSFLNRIKEKKPNMILLDMMLPDISGKEILSKVRNNCSFDDVDIIIISANCLTMDKVDGLDLGADDYIEKPFNLLELISRINSKVRRHNKSKIYVKDNLTLDLDKHICLLDGKEIQLTVKEFDILAYLFRANGNVVSREELLSYLWGENEAYESRTIDVHVKAIRKKIKDDQQKIIKTIYGIGYQVLL